MYNVILLLSYGQFPECTVGLEINVADVQLTVADMEIVESCRLDSPLGYGFGLHVDGTRNLIVYPKLAELNMQ